MQQGSLVEDLTREVEELTKAIFRLNDERIRLDAELKAKAELLRRLAAEQGGPSPMAVAEARRPAEGQTWSQAILMCVQDLGGKASLRQVYAGIGQYVALSSRHNKETTWGRRPAYQHEVRSFISGLVTSGQVRRVSRGVYEMTREGEQALARAGGRWQPTEDL